MLNLQDVELKLGKKKVLNKLNLEVMEHELCGLVGPEYSGKSILCRVVAGLVTPDSGEVLYLGRNISKDELYRWDIGYMPEKVELYRYQQVLEYYIFFGQLYGMSTQIAKQRALEVLERIGLTNAKEEYLSKLNKGTRQKLLVGRALLHRPRLLILDEVLTGIDPVSKVELQALLMDLKKQGLSILCTSSDLDSISKICDKIAIIDAGTIVAVGTVEEILHLKQRSNPILVRVNRGIEEAVGVLRSNPRVTSLSRKENVISIWFDGEEGEEAFILSQLVQCGIEVSAFYREESDFDSLYLKITQATEK